MNFRSDNTAATAPEILQAIVEANAADTSRAYGEDNWSKQLDARLSEVFECQVRVFTVASGTAANAIALASAVPPWGAILCHREAHIERDECGAVEFATGGAKLALIEGGGAKVTAAAVEGAIARNGGDIHSPVLSALSISQATERGAIYDPDEVAALGALAGKHKWAFHVDGARFGNAVAALGCSPADITWRAGVNLLSFGATKNGALAAEAIVAFDSRFADAIERRRKRGGHLLCKGRYPAVQLLAYLKDGLWLKMARRANALAGSLGEAAGERLSTPVQTNQVFVKLGDAGVAKLREAGVEFYEWGARGSGEVRLVVAWSQREDDVEAMRGLLASLH
ncbi:MAG: low specificity L-threonine aldolase [Proteobacteria bacterium]|nr:low specificity L-threonine aldolase [Pseudomonadota bacterium]